MHCGPGICTAGLSVMITPGPQAINQLKHPIVRDLAGIHALRPRASCVYTSQIPHWGVLTNTYDLSPGSDTKLVCEGGEAWE